MGFPQALCVALLAVLSAQLGHCQVLSLNPSSEIFVPPQVVGNNASGTAVSLYGCQDSGATLSTITLYANTAYIRGMSVSLTNGSNVLYGCVNVTATGSGAGGCNTTNVTSASFTFQAGERVTNMTLWPGYNSQGQANQRAGAVNFRTSLGNLFDFGMNNTRIDPVTVDVGSGIPCGVNPRAGADIDALGFVFLRTVTSSVLTNVQYESIGQQSQSGFNNTNAGSIEGNSSTITLSDQTYNNSIQTTNLTATFASQAPSDAMAYWSSDIGLDTYLTSSVTTALPLLSANSTADSASSWSLGTTGNHSRNENNATALSWNYTINVQPGGISRVAVTAVQSSISTAYTGTLNMTLDSQYVLAIPVEGDFEGEGTSPVSVQTTEIKAGKQPSTESKGGHSNTLAWVLGVVFGVLGGLIFAALLAWAIVACMRRRREREENEGQDPPSNKKSFIPGFVKLGGKPQGGKGGKGGKDVEMGAAARTGGKEEKWEPDPKVAPVMGVPVNNSRANGVHSNENDLPEHEGGFVVPYNKFRRLRLESIRQALGLRNEEGSAQQQATQDASSYTPPRNTPEGLSNPPSGASTPRSIQNTPLPAAAGPFSATHQGPNLDEDGKSETDIEAGRSPRALPLQKPSPARSLGGSQTMKDRVAAIRAERKGNVSPRASPTPSQDPTQDPAQDSQPTAVDPQLKTATPLEKGKSAVLKVSSSISSLVSKYSNRGSIKHDNTNISLTGRPKVASQATPAEIPVNTPRASTPKAPQEPARRNSTPWALEPINLEPSPSKSSSPKNSILKAATPKAVTPRAATPTDSTSQATAPETPAIATPQATRPGSKTIIPEEKLPKLKVGSRKLQPTADGKFLPSNVIEFGDTHIKLGDKYQTQGRNE